MCVHTWQVHPCLCICTHMNTQTRKLNKSALATHQKAGPCWALWRMERNHAEQGQAEGRKERRGAYNGTGSYGWAGLGWRSTCTEAQYSKWHRTIWAYWYARVISVLRNRQHRGHKFKVILGCETTLNLVKATGELVSASHPTLLPTTTTKRNKPRKNCYNQVHKYKRIHVFVC